MRIFAITIKPLSPFGTPLKGDTIFGQFCWQAAEDPEILAKGLSHWIGCYPERPFAVFSSAWPKITSTGKTIFAIRRPQLPPPLFDDAEKAADCSKRYISRKESKGRKWLLVEKDLQVRLDSNNLLDDQSLYKRLLESLSADERKRLRSAPVRNRRPASTAEQQHNTINRLTMTTGRGEFAPYATENTHFMPGLELCIFAGMDEDACGMDQLRAAFAQMGKWGFGRDASTGLGRFSVVGVEEISVPVTVKANACLTLGPCVPEPGSSRVMYFNPFTRFGRHGARLIHTGRPFKNPVLMADEGAVFIPHVGKFPDKPYVGRAVLNVSKAQPEAVCQGYSLYLPMQLPAQNEGGIHA